MVACLFVQRTNTRETRAARLFIPLVLAIITLICGFFLIMDWAVPEWFVIAGRWLPALVALATIRAVPLPGGLVRWFGLRPPGRRQLVGGSVAAVVALIVVYAVSVLPFVLLGRAELQQWSALGQVAIMLVPMILLFSISTLGEEAAWRGFLQNALAGLGFWRASALIAAVWVLFHVPLHGTMAIQGTLPWPIAITTTVGLFPLGLFLSAVAVRFGCVWPAVFAHALPFSALNLLSNVDELPIDLHWALLGVTTLLLLGIVVGWMNSSRSWTPSPTPPTPRS